MTLRQFCHHDVMSSLSSYLQLDLLLLEWKAEMWDIYLIGAMLAKNRWVTTGGSIQVKGKVRVLPLSLERLCHTKMNLTQQNSNQFYWSHLRVGTVSCQYGCHDWGLHIRVWLVVAVVLAEWRRIVTRNSSSGSSCGQEMFRLSAQWRNQSTRYMWARAKRFHQK